MKAITINKYGGTEVIETSNDSQNPAVKAGQVLVEVHAASLNRIDTSNSCWLSAPNDAIKFPFGFGW